MEKSVRLDLEDEAAGTVAPLCNVDDAAMIVSRRRGAADRERDEAMIAHNNRGRVVQRRSIERARQRPLGVTAERRSSRFVGSHVVAVSASEGAESRVKLRAHLVRRRPPDVARHQGVQCAPPGRGGPSFRHPNSDRLAARVFHGSNACL